MIGPRFTLPHLLLAMAIGLASMPTDIYQICARNVGILKIEPWRSKASRAITRLGRTLSDRVRRWLASGGGWQLATATVVLVALATSTADAHSLSAVGFMAGSIKIARQRVEDLHASIAQAKKDRAAIGEKPIAEKRAMTDEERTAFAAKGTEITALEGQLADAKELLTAAEAAAEAQRTAPAPEPPKVELGLDSLEKQDKAKVPGFFGRQLLAVRKMALAAKGHDEVVTAEDRQLVKMMGAATGANTDVPADGGFLVGQQRTSEVLQRAYSTGEVLSRVNRMPIGAGFNGAKLPAIDETSRADGSRFGGIVSGWLGQGNEPANTGKPKFRELDLKLRKVGAFVYTTDELVVDAVLFEAWVNRNLPLELQFRTEDAVVNGTGGNQPLGLMSSPSAIAVARSGAGHVTAEDLRAMHARLWAPLRSSAVFLIDQDVEPEFDSLSVAIGTGGTLDPSFKAAGSVPGQKYATYKGIPIIPVEYCQALGTTGDIILTSLQEYLLIDKGGVEQAVSLHVAFLSDQGVFRFIYRVDGQNTWNAALTPKSGGSTKSPVIVLT